jgi:hypothetical protein
LEAKELASLSKKARKYDKGERRFKHVGKSGEPEVVLQPGEPKRWVGKCPNTLTAADHARLLNEAIATNNGDRELNCPKSVYVVNDGAIYKADTTDRGKSYHGYPYRGKLPKQLVEQLREQAKNKNCEAKFEEWVESHITLHGTW